MRWLFISMLCLNCFIFTWSYPFDESSTLFAFGQDDEVLEEGPDVVKELKLSFPVSFGKQLYGSVFISENGLVTFRQALGEIGFTPLISSIYSPIIAPFFADIDSSLQGKIYYREENKNGDELLRFDELISKYFDQAVETKSIIVVTWYRMAPKNSKTPPLQNTFQLAIGSSEGQSYVAFSYPLSGIQWADVKTDPNRPNVWAQAGIFDGYGNGISLKESGNPRMISLDRRSNTLERGLFLYRVDNTTREPQIPTHDTNTCELGADPCHPDAKCQDFSSYFCCSCPPGTFGNGYFCHESGTHQAYHIVGKLRGVLNNIQIEESDFYGFGNLSTGVSYMSITANQNLLAAELQSLFPASGGLHWLFGKTTSEGKSGFVLTEAKFNRTSILSFPKYNSVIKLFEEYQGISYDNVIRVAINVEGNLPRIPGVLQLQVPEYVNVFDNSEFGYLRSNSTQQFLIEGQGQEPLVFNVYQTIEFKQSSCDKELFASPIKVVVNRGSVRVDDRKSPSRVHMHAEVDLRIGKAAIDICAAVDCGEATCVPNGDIAYRCVCNPGSEFRNGKCITVAATPALRSCANQPNICTRNSYCEDTRHGPRCRCENGYTDIGQSCELIQGFPVENQDRSCSRPCHPRASCVNYNGDFVCRCMKGTVGDGVNVCREVTCEDDHSLCPVNAHCVNSTCACNRGYKGDGTTCTRDILEKRSDRVIYTRGIAILEVPDTPSRSAPTKLLALGLDSSEIVGVAVDCEHEQIYYTDTINGKIVRVRVDGKHKEEVITGLVHPEGIAVDSASRNIFWVDSGSKKIQVAPVDNFNYIYTIVDTDLDSPRGIAIHPQKGKVYFSDRSLEFPKIESITMDGSERTVIIGNELEIPNMLAIDVENDELCWTDAGRKTVECVSLDSSIVPTSRSRRVVYKSQAFDSKMFGIAIYQKRIYWTDWNIPYLHVLDRANTTQLDPQKYAQAAAGSSRPYSVAIAPQHCHRVRTPCEVRRGDCPFMCLPTDSYGKSCVCPDALKGTGQCKVVSPFTMTPPPPYFEM